MVNPSTHCISYSAPTSASASVDCSEVVSCLTPGSIPSSALSGPIALALLASGALPVGITIAPTQVTPGTFGSGVLLPASQLTGVIPSANLPPTTHTTTWDPIGNTYTSVVNGVSAVSSFGSLDDEGVTVAIVGGVLQLKNKAGVIIGSTPVPDSDGQILSLTADPTAVTIALTNGGSAKFTCSEIYGLFKAATTAPAASISLLADDCQKYTIAQIARATVTASGSLVGPMTTTVDPATGAIVQSFGGVAQPSFTPAIPCSKVLACVNQPGAIALSSLASGALPTGVTVATSQLTGTIAASQLPPTTVSNTVAGSGATRTLTTTVNGIAGAAVAVPDADDQQLSIAGSVISLSNGGSVTVPTSPPAPTTHVNSWTQASGLQESVNGVTSNIAIPLGIPVMVLGYNAAGAPVFAPIVPTVKVRETQVNVAAGVSVPTQYSGPTLITPYTAQYDVRSLFIVDGPNATIVLTPPPPNLTGEITGVEFDVKLLGTWVGSVTIAPSGGALIDGAATATFSKTAVTQPSRSIRWISPNWIFV